MNHYLTYNNLLRLVNIQRAYEVFGKNSIIPYVIATVSDEKLQEIFPDSYKKNYLTNIAFYGYLAYKSAKKISDSKILDPKLNVLLQMSMYVTAVSIVFRGRDNFEMPKESPIKKLQVYSRLHGDESQICKIEKEFEKSFLSGIKYLCNNMISIVSDELVVSLVSSNLISIAESIANSYIAQRFVYDQFAALSSKKNGQHITYLMSGLGGVLMQYCTSRFCKYLKNSLDKSIERKVEARVNQVVLGNTSPECVIKHSDDLSQLASKSKSLKYSIERDTTKLFETVLSPLLEKFDPESQDSYKVVFNDYPQLLLIRSLFQNLEGGSIVNMVRGFTGNTSQTSQNPFEKNELQKIGSVSLSVRSTPESYIFGHINQIAILGAQETASTILRQYREYLLTTNTESYVDESENLDKLLRVIKFFIEINFSDMSSENISKVNLHLDNVMKELGLTRSYGEEDNLVASFVERTINSIEGYISDTAQRLRSDDFVLKFEDYELIKYHDTANGLSSKTLLKIRDFSFVPGRIYAIQGKSGLGKSTIISDIAKSLDVRVFSSKGKIYYPDYEGEQCEMIFCNTENIDIPGLNLLQKMSFKLPSSYVEASKDVVVRDIIEIWRSFGHEITEEQLMKKDSKLSTGQLKLTTFTNIILYKKYINKPVLLVIDETLTNLDVDTSKKVSSIIKKIFEDSIVISVDHDGHVKDYFYTHIVSLSSYETGSVNPCICKIEEYEEGISDVYAGQGFASSMPGGDLVDALEDGQVVDIAGGSEDSVIH